MYIKCDFALESISHIKPNAFANWRVTADQSSVWMRIGVQITCEQFITYTKVTSLKSAIHVSHYTRVQKTNTMRNPEQILISLAALNTSVAFGISWVITISLAHLNPSGFCICLRAKRKLDNNMKIKMKGNHTRTNTERTEQPNVNVTE